MTLLTKEHQKSYQNGNMCYICKEKIKDIHVKDKKYCKVRDLCHYTVGYRGVAHSICNLKYSIPKNSPIAFYKRP